MGYRIEYLKSERIIPIGEVFNEDNPGHIALIQEMAQAREGCVGTKTTTKTE